MQIFIFKNGRQQNIVTKCEKETNRKNKSKETLNKKLSVVNLNLKKKKTYILFVRAPWEPSEDPSPAAEVVALELPS